MTRGGSLRSADRAAPENLAFVVWSHGRIIHATRGIAPGAWRRHLHLMLDSFRADRAHPLLEPPLTRDQLYQAMLRLDQQQEALDQVGPVVRVLERMRRVSNIADPTPVPITVDNATSTTLDSVLFKPDSSDFAAPSDAYTILAPFVERARNEGVSRVQVVGRAAAFGDAEGARRLSKARADAVAKVPSIGP